MIHKILHVRMNTESMMDMFCIDEAEAICNLLCALYNGLWCATHAMYKDE